MRRFVVAILLSAFLLTLLFVGCAPITPGGEGAAGGSGTVPPQPTSPLPPGQPPDPIADKSCPALLQSTVQRVAYERRVVERTFSVGEQIVSTEYVDGQLLLTGRPDDLARVLEALPDLFPYPKEPLVVFDLGKYGDGLTVALVRLARGVDAVNALQLFYQTAQKLKESQAISPNALLFADPNYLFGSPTVGKGSPARREGPPLTDFPQEGVGDGPTQLAAASQPTSTNVSGEGGVEGSPGSGEGSPGSGEGSPGSGEGSPGSGEGSPGSGEGSPGSGEGSPGSGEGSPGTGEGSSGPGEGGGGSAEGSGGDTATAASNQFSFWGQWALAERGVRLFVNSARTSSIESAKGIEIAIFDTSPFAQPGGYRFEGEGWITPTMEVCVSHPISMPVDRGTGHDHGLFVTGLAHAMAPASDLHLIRVLGNGVKGELIHILEALSLYANARADALDHTVINMSFGIVSSELPLTELEEEAIAAICQAQGISCGVDGGDPALPVAVLELLLERLSQDGAVLVAAAGNKSSDVQVLPAQAPANYPYVLGVAGSNFTRQRACFSNSSIDISAPAGDYQLPGCTPEAVATCSNNPKFCLKSYSLLISRPTGYAYWAGTSFATPLVAGLAAIELEKGGAVGTNINTAVVQHACSIAPIELGGGIGNAAPSC
jgi:hypothetical protein